MKDSDPVPSSAELTESIRKMRAELLRIDEKIERETHVPEGYRLVFTSDGYSVVRVR